MKVGILTYHNTANYGAALQAFATQQVLSNIGLENEIIDYTNEFRKGHYSVKNRIFNQIKAKQLLQAFKTCTAIYQIHKRNKNFKLFYQSRICMSDSKYSTTKSLRDNPPVYDVYLVGSDQVWNYHNNGKDLNYLLDFVYDKSKTISYASSFGVLSIIDSLKNDYARALSQIRFLSVREKIGAEIVWKLTSRKIPVVLDPVFLIDKDQWCELFKISKTLEANYIVNYTNNPGYIDKFIAGTKYDIYKSHVVNIGTGISFNDLISRNVKIRSTVGPEIFLSIINHSELVLTSSFHGVAFSIILNRPFVAFLSGDEGRDSRIVDLLSLLGLSHRIFHPKMDIEAVKNEFNYKLVNKKLLEHRMLSINYLKTAFQEISSDLH